MRVLVVRVGQVGDMVMCTPALTALLEQVPQAELTLLTSQAGKRTLRDFSPRLQTFWTYDRKHWFAGAQRARLRRQVRAAGFSHIYCFESNPSYLALLQGTPAQVHTLAEDRNEVHYAQRMLDTVARSLGRTLGFYPLSLPVGPEAEASARRFLADHGVGPKTFLLALHPTFSGSQNWIKVLATGTERIWPLSAYAELASRLRAYAQAQAIDMELVMNVMPNEVRIAEKVAALSRGSVKLLCPAPNFPNYLAFIKRVDLLVVPNTGPMHIAAALGTPMVALFAGKHPLECGPFGRSEKWRIVRAEEMDPPRTVMSAITVDRVYAACTQQIQYLLSNPSPLPIQPLSGMVPPAGAS